MKTWKKTRKKNVKKRTKNGRKGEKEEEALLPRYEQRAVAIIFVLHVSENDAYLSSSLALPIGDITRSNRDNNYTVVMEMEENCYVICNGIISSKTFLYRRRSGLCN